MNSHYRYLIAAPGLFMVVALAACGANVVDSSYKEEEADETSQATTAPLEDVLPPRSIVDDDGKQCPRAKYKTIQAAVNAATKGDTILVCAGTYRENSTVNKTVKLLGAQHGVDGRTRKANPATESLIVTGGFTVAANNVVFDGFSLDAFFAPDEDTAFGLFLDPDHSGTQVINNVMGGEAGALFLGSNGDVQTLVRHNKFTGRGVFGSDDDVSAIARNERIEANVFDQALLSFSGSGHRDLLVLNNEMTGGGSMSFYDNVFPKDNPPRTHGVTVQGNTIVGSTDAAILLRHVGDAQFQGNSLQDGSSAGFLIIGTNKDVLISGNAISGFGAGGIQVGELPSEGTPQEVTTGLTIEGNALANDASGIALLFSRGNEFSQNTIDHSGDVGIEVDENSLNNKFETNQVSHSKQLDCRDGSMGSGTSRTHDTWVGDTGGTSSPPGLCVHPLL
jgi:hypothetical protein